MLLGQRIKLTREGKGLTQQDLATISGVCQQMISKLETGRSQHTGDIVKLACALDVSPLWLEGLTDGNRETGFSSGQAPDQRITKICLEFLAREKLHNSSFHKQAKLFCDCYALCAKAENRKLSTQAMLKLLEKQLPAVPD